MEFLDKLKSWGKKLHKKVKDNLGKVGLVAAGLFAGGLLLDLALFTAAGAVLGAGALAVFVVDKVRE